MLPPAMRTLNFRVSMLDKVRRMSVLIDVYCENQGLHCGKGRFIPYVKYQWVGNSNNGGRNLRCPTTDLYKITVRWKSASALRESECYSV